MLCLEVPVYIFSLKFTEDTITDLVNTTSGVRSMLLWAKVYGFWLGVGLGTILMLVGVVRAILTPLFLK
jgi:hypothetical protein